MNKRLTLNRADGFTIVELLVVIVIIGILASIAIVSYSGITARANTTSAQSAARTITQKSELYAIEKGRYPLQLSDLTSENGTTYYLPPSAYTASLLSAQPATPSSIKIIKCGTTPNTLQSDITIANIKGIRVYYWSYTDMNANSYTRAGVDTGAGVTCPTS